MEIYATTAQSQKPTNFTCPDQAEIWKALFQGSVETMNLIEYSPLAFTERTGSDIVTTAGHHFEINTSFGDDTLGDQFNGTYAYLDSITINGIDIKKMNFTDEFRRELEVHGEDYINELNE